MNVLNKIKSKANKQNLQSQPINPSTQHQNDPSINHKYSLNSKLPTYKQYSNHDSPVHNHSSYPQSKPPNHSLKILDKLSKFPIYQPPPPDPIISEQPDPQEESLSKYRERPSNLSNLSQTSDLLSRSHSENFSYQKILSREKIKVNEGDLWADDLSVDQCEQINEVMVRRSYQIGDMMIFEGTLTTLRIQKMSKKMTKDKRECFQKIEEFLKKCTCNSQSLKRYLTKYLPSATQYLSESSECTISESVKPNGGLTLVDNAARIYGKGLICVGDKQFILEEDGVIRYVEKRGSHFVRNPSSRY